MANFSEQVSRLKISSNWSGCFFHPIFPSFRFLYGIRFQIECGTRIMFCSFMRFSERTKRRKKNWKCSLFIAMQFKLSIIQTLLFSKSNLFFMTYSINPKLFHLFRPSIVDSLSSLLYQWDEKKYLSPLWMWIIFWNIEYGHGSGLWQFFHMQILLFFFFRDA